jgi:uncharacterized protein (DUF111 family)
MKTVLVLRTPSGISGDMLLTGLAKLSNASGASLERLVEKIGVSELRACLEIKRASVEGISGWRAAVSLAPAHHHRKASDIFKIIAKSRLSPRAKKIATKAFRLLAVAEAEVHGVAQRDIEFHEIGSLDSLLDVCLAAALFDVVSPDCFFCSPLPVCDGVISCAHGLMASPAPAVLGLLEDVPVYGIESSGETVTPTALALLKAMGARFGKWPSLVIEKTVRVFGGRILPGVPNGAIFATGTAHEVSFCKAKK